MARILRVCRESQSVTPGIGSRLPVRNARAAVVLAISLACGFFTDAHAQIRTDGTLGRPAVALGGPSFVIDETLGKQSGSNLFHSFGVFNVGLGESATFMTTTAGLANVISRVTGGSSSQINGPVRLTSSNAAPSFFFINPAGVIFGQGARIDVPAGFHVSTANYVNFPDGNFYADPKAVSVLSSAAPEAFGFLGTTRAAITIKEGALLATPLPGTGRPISVVAGDIEITDDGAMLTGGSTIRAIAVGAGAQEVRLNGAVSNASGNLGLRNGGTLLSTPIGDSKAGDILVAAGNVTIDGQGRSVADGIVTGIVSLTVGSTVAGSVDVAVTGTLSILDGGVIATESYSAENAGAITVSAGSIAIDGRGQSPAPGNLTGISGATYGSGSGGAIVIGTRERLSIVNGGSISSNSHASGNAGTIKVAADTLVIDGQGSSAFTHIASDAAGGTGNAGNVEVAVGRTLTILDGGSVSSSTYSTGSAGTVRISAGDMAIDGRGGSTNTGIFSDASARTGDAGNVDVTVGGTLSIVNAGEIRSSTFTTGNAGTVKVAAGEMIIDGQGSRSFTGITGDTYFGTGDAGDVAVTVERTLSIVNGGDISSRTFGSGNAGSIKVAAGDIVIDGQDGSLSTGILSDALGESGNAGSIDVSAERRLSIVNGGSISSDATASGNAGAIKVTAANIVIDGKGNFGTQISSIAFSGTGDAGNIDVTARGSLSLVDGGLIRTDTNSAGNAGTIKVTAADIAIDGRGGRAGTGISSISIFGTGNSGRIDVTANGLLSIVDGGAISASTSTSGHGGTVNVSAGDILIDARASIFFTHVSSSAFGGTGDAGDVGVTASGTLSLINGGSISSDTNASGNAGKVKVSTGDMIIDGRGGDTSTKVSSSAFNGTGNAGDVEVSVSRTLSIVNGGTISSDTFTAGNAGTVKVAAGEMVIDAQGGFSFTRVSSDARRGTGNAGNVEVTVGGTLSVVDGGRISSDTRSAGNAGTVKVSARDMVIDSRGGLLSTEVSSNAFTEAGDAGNVEVTVGGSLSIVDGAAINTSTSGPGRAGSVRVTAGTISGDSGAFVGANAYAGSSGQTGAVTIDASGGIALANGALFSIRNGATIPDPGRVTPTLLAVTAPSISLANGGQMTAESFGNVAASNIDVNFGPKLNLINAGIITSAKDGNGGSIGIRGSGTLVLQNGQIATSVAGVRGNGGDISIQTPILVMQTGFIQANTAAANASGGNVNMQVGTLLPSGGTLFVGGSTPYAFAPGVFGFNVIQAAAPDGVSGTIRFSAPVLDITGSLSALPSRFLDAGGLGRSPCAITGGSALSQSGRGGLPRAAGDAIWLGRLFGAGATLPAGASGAGTAVWLHDAVADSVRSPAAPCAS